MDMIRLCALLIAMALTACASKQPAYCVTETHEIKVSLQHRDAAPGVHLVRISKSQRVTLRDESGELVSAKPGEEFLLRNGLSAGYSLESVDVRSGTVTLGQKEFVMHAAQ